MRFSFAALFALSFAIVTVGCGSDQGSSDESACGPDETEDPMTGECVPAGTEDTGPSSGTDTAETSDPGSEDTGMSTADTGTPEDTGSSGGDPEDTGSGTDDTGGGGDWSPSLDSLYADMQGCTLPDCDESGDRGFDKSGQWVRTLTTTASDCSDTIKQQDPRAEVGNEEVSDPFTLDNFSGQCQTDAEDTHIATAKSGTVARCEQNERQLGVTAFETSVVDFDDAAGTGTGKAKVYITNVPDLVGDDCTIEFDVKYERQ